MGLGDFLADQVLLSHDGPAWHGAALAENLHGLTAQEAAARPIAGGHTIWEIVLHTAAWAREVHRRLQSGHPDLPLEGDWPAGPDTSARAWSRHLVRRTRSRCKLG